MVIALVAGIVFGVLAAIIPPGKCRDRNRRRCATNRRLSFFVRSQQLRLLTTNPVEAYSPPLYSEVSPWRTASIDSRTRLSHFGLCIMWLTGFPPCEG